MIIFVLLLGIPLCAAILSHILPSSKQRMLEVLAVTAAGLELAVVLIASRSVMATGTYAAGQAFFIDGLGLLLLLIITSIGLAASIYSVGYLREEQKKNIIDFTRFRTYFRLFHAFILAMIVAVVTTSPIIMWISIEATTLSTAFLVSFYNKASASEAAWKYLIINSVGLLLALLGTLMFVSIAGQSGLGTEYLSWQAFWAASTDLQPLALKVAFIFVLVGFGTKVGFVPLHTWRPDSYAKAPVPVAALLSGVLLNVSWLAILRFKLVTDLAIGPVFSQKLLLFFGVISIIVAAGILLVQKNYKRMLAYSSTEHAGIIALGFGFGGIGMAASLAHMLYHALVKSLLFFAAGNIFLKYSSTKIQNVRGVLKALPVTGVIFFIGILVLVGMPPFGIFFTKFAILASGIKDHAWVVIGVGVALAIVFVGLIRHTASMLFGAVPEGVAQGEGNAWTLVPVFFVLALLVLASFALPQSFIQLVLQSVSST